MPDLPFDSDVVVIGGGNAGLCAALSASQAGASVTVLECAPPEFRGGNSRHTRNMRTMHERPTALLPGSYSEQEYLDDLLRVTGGRTDEQVARTVIRESADAARWMACHGVRFQPAPGRTLSLDRTNAFFLGGGKALLNAYYRAAEKRGVRIVYQAEVTDLSIRQGLFESGAALVAGRPAAFRARALVAAAGGFEANLEWLKEAWGPAAENFLVRGTPYNRGVVLKLLLAAGAASVGDPTQCHAVAIDGRAPKFDGGIVTRLDSIPLGIAVNDQAERFYDEGEDLWPKRYAIWGRLVASQPHQIAFSIFDSKVIDRFMPSVFPPFTADSIAGLAAALGLPADHLESTVREYNRSVVPGKFNHQVLDDCHTCGLTPSKSHWAQPIDAPPFYGYPLRPGITFTYLGVKVDNNARVEMRSGTAARNIFAAGEIMAGNILGQGYLAGFGMAIGTVFGRIAGREAARAAK